MEIRAAVLDDISEITAIYNSIVLSSTAVYNDTPATIEQRVAWWRARVDQGFPVLVAVENGVVLGYASFGEFRPWPGYRFTVEGTIHIREDVRGRGVGKGLLQELLASARAMGKHVMVAGVDAENAASLRFLEAAGFVPAGHLREVGFKFGRYLDLRFLQYWLTDPPVANPSIPQAKLEVGLTSVVPGEAGP
ncbi:MAG TPA: GNAT family N-acetyltransferase [Acidobacteriaceae bacterium]|jgi:phosphinothricin acetyltransferase|nr:GNAT family N-acetyltransferase [Acidobacteriaceae bacterium]